MKRVSPHVLIELLQVTGPPFYRYYASLEPYADAPFPVAWAGEEKSTNWMHIAREYTEKFLHQQQIRDAVGKQGILTEEFFLPFLDVCMYALPHTLRDTRVASGSTVQMKITGAVKGEWCFVFEGAGWRRMEGKSSVTPITEIRIDSNASWKLFSKSLRPNDLESQIEILGDQELGKVAVEMVSFMA